MSLITQLTERLTLAQRQWATALIWTTGEIVVIRAMPLMIGYPSLIYTLYESVTNGCGILMAMYFFWDLARWAKYRNAPNISASPALAQAQAVMSRRECLINEGMSLPAMMLVGMVALGVVVPQLMDNTAYQLVIAILLIILIASVFTMIGRNSTGTIVVVMLALVIIAIFFKGADVLWQAVDRWLEKERTAQPHNIRVEDIQGGPIHDLLNLARGVYSQPWGVPIGYTYNCLPALFNAFVGGFMVSLIVIEDQLGPGELIAEAARLQNRVRDPATSPAGWSPVHSRWVMTWVANTALHVWYVTRDPFPLIMKAAATYAAYKAYKDFTIWGWRTAGQLVSTSDGRLDVDMVVGAGPMKGRESLVKLAGVLALTGWSTLIGPYMPGAVGCLLIALHDHRVLCGLMTILTLDIGWLAGITHPHSLTRDAERTQLPANAQLETGANGFSNYRTRRRSPDRNQQNPAIQNTNTTQTTDSTQAQEAAVQATGEEQVETRSIEVQTELHQHVSDPPIATRLRRARR